MRVSEAENLCTRCGLCCGGRLFADVEVTRREAPRLEAMGLEIDEEDGGMVLVQPCRALKGTRCSIYEFRPQCCRTFECKVLQELKSGLLSFTEAEARVTEAKRRIRLEGVGSDAAQELLGYR